METSQIRNQLESASRPWRQVLESFDRANETGVRVKKKVKASTRELYIKVLVRFARNVKKPLESLTEEDLKLYLGSIENKYTNRHTCATLKKFFKFARREDLAALISVPNITTSQRIDDIDRVSAEEVKKLLQAEDNARNQALIALLYESAGRLSEVLALKVKDVTVDKYGCIVKLFGKTQLRNIRLIATSPYIIRWLQLHAHRNDPEAPLFYTTYEFLGKREREQHAKYKPLGKTMTAKIIWKAASKAGFEGEQLKKFHPHAFRHGRLSELGHDLTDSEMKHIGGWTDDARRMISLYSHVDEDRVNNKLLSLQGLTVEEEKKVSELQAKACPRCKSLNAQTDLYCSVCGIPLTKEGQKALADADAQIANYAKLLGALKAEHEELRRAIEKDEIEPEWSKQLRKELDEFHKLQEAKVRAEGYKNMKEYMRALGRKVGKEIRKRDGKK